MQDSLDWALQARTTNTILHRPVTSLRHREGGRVFWDGPKFFELCPTQSPRGGEKFSWGFAPVGYAPAFAWLFTLETGYSILVQWKDTTQVYSSGVI